VCLAVRMVAILLGTAGLWPAEQAQAGAVVVMNRTASPVPLTLVLPDGKTYSHVLLADDQLLVPGLGTATIAFQADGKWRHYALQANGVYDLAMREGRLDLSKVDIRGMPTSPAPPLAAAGQDLLCTIPVKLLTDDKEPAVQRVWEQRLRKRLAAASAVFERYCRIGFEVAEVDTWRSIDKPRDLDELVEHFEREVRPAPGRVAVGFTAHYAALREEKHLGGARGGLGSHILIREWAPGVTEMERIEILVHELAHFCGAVHASDPNGVMRPKLGDGRARARSARIRFDAVNALAMYLIAEELRARPAVRFDQLQTGTRMQLRALYGVLAASLPDDPAAPRYIAMLDRSLGLLPAPPDRRAVIAEAAGRVVRAILDRAVTQGRLPLPAVATAERGRVDGDRLTEDYVRRAAAAARQLPADVGPRSFLLGLGVALDDTFLVGSTPVVGSFWRQIESLAQRSGREGALRTATMRGRHDLAQHFAVSAALAVLLGAGGAEAIGISKELLDAQGESGFSFLDLAADLAGIRFAGAVTEGRIGLATLEASFQVDDFLPRLDGLTEGIAWNDFVNAYGSPPDQRFHRQREAILQRIRALPGFQGRRVAHGPPTDQ